MTRISSLAVVVSCCLVAVSVHAQELPPPPPPPQEEAMVPPPTPTPEPPATPATPSYTGYRPQKRSGGEPDVQHTISITLSPIHLLTPIGEVSAEFRLLDKLSVAGIVGFGQVSSLGLRATVFEAGAQVRYYLVGTFIHGLHVGAEVLGIFVSVPTGTVSSATGQGVSLAPFVGYKIASNVGFTFEIQLGPAFTLVGAQAGGQSASQSNIAPMLNLNVGWSF